MTPENASAQPEPPAADVPDKSSNGVEKVEDTEEKGRTIVARKEKYLAEFNAAIDKLNKDYNAGKPIFKKSSMLELAVQLEKIRETGEKAEVIITDLNGHKVSLGEVNRENLHGSKGSYVAASNQPHITYNPICRLTERPTDNFNPEHFYPYGRRGVVRRIQRPLTIGHYGLTCDRETGEIVPEKPPPALPEIQAGFREKQAEWEASDCCREFKQILASVDIPKVKNLVGLAFHSLRPDTGHFQNSARQHSIYLTLRDFFNSRATNSSNVSNNDDASKNNNLVECIVQDPAYIEADEKILAEEDIKVVEDPHAFLQIDDDSAIISVYPNVPVKEIVADIARPAFILWCYDSRREETSWTKCSVTDPILPHTIDMLRDHYIRIPFPPDGLHNYPLVIFIRKTKS